MVENVDITEKNVSENKKKILDRFLIPLILFLATFIIYYFTSGGQTVFDYFVRLAVAFLHGHLYLTEGPSWLSELIPLNGKYYVIFPPMPAIIILPFVFIQGPNFDQTLATIVLGSLNSVLVYLLVKKILNSKITDIDNKKINIDNKKIETLAIWMSILFTFGTIQWFLASVGSGWYDAQVTAIFFLLLALNELFGKGRALLTGLFLGAAYWSRLPVILSFVFFLLIILDNWKSRTRKNIKDNIGDIGRIYLLFFIGIGIFVFLDFIYNYLRFGTIFDVGYYLQPGVMQESICKNGYFRLDYIPEHLSIFFLKGPIFVKQFPYIEPSWAGMAIWITTPTFIYALKSPIDKLTLYCWLAIIPIAMVVMSHCGTGYSQFGYRYGFDFYPFLLILTTRGIGNNIRWHHKILIVTSILVNLLGVIWINKFGWVGW
jgi:hypothetical protein